MIQRNTLVKASQKVMLSRLRSALTSLTTITVATSPPKNWSTRSELWASTSKLSKSLTSSTTTLPLKSWTSACSLRSSVLAGIALQKAPSASSTKSLTPTELAALALKTSKRLPPVLVKVSQLPKLIK